MLNQRQLLQITFLTFVCLENYFVGDLLHNFLRPSVRLDGL